MDVEYSVGPRILPDGTNMDADIVASIPVEYTVEISEPVSRLEGRGYQQGQRNLDGSEL